MNLIYTYLLLTSLVNPTYPTNFMIFENWCNAQKGSIVSQCFCVTKTQVVAYSDDSNWTKKIGQLFDLSFDDQKEMGFFIFKENPYLESILELIKKNRLPIKIYILDNTYEERL